MSILLLVECMSKDMDLALLNFLVRHSLRIPIAFYENFLTQSFPSYVQISPRLSVEWMIAGDQHLLLHSGANPRTHPRPNTVMTGRQQPVHILTQPNKHSKQQMISILVQNYQFRLNGALTTHMLDCVFRCVLLVFHWTFLSSYTTYDASTIFFMQTKCGLSKKSGCDLRKTDFLMHLNPNTQDIDNTTHLFYKGFVRNGHLMLPNAGLTGH